MKFLLSGIGLLLLLNSCTMFRPSAAKIVNSSKQAIREINALEYNGKLVIQVHSELQPASEDIRVYGAAVKLLKDSTLKPVGYQVKMETLDSNLLVCNQDSFYFLVRVRQEMHASALGEKPPSLLNNHAFRSVISEAFLYPDPFNPNPDWHTEIALLGTEKIDGQKFRVIQTRQKAENEWELTRLFYINRKTYLPLRVKSTFREISIYQEPGRVDLLEWNATNVNYNPGFGNDEFARPALPPDYNIVFKKAFE